MEGNICFSARNSSLQKEKKHLEIAIHPLLSNHSNPASWRGVCDPKKSTCSGETALPLYHWEFLRPLNVSVRGRLTHAASSAKDEQVFPHRVTKNAQYKKLKCQCWRSDRITGVPSFGENTDDVEKNITLWFIQVESNFALAKITNDLTKYNHLIASIDPETLSAEQIRRLLSEPHLGANKPSQLLRKMRELDDSTGIKDDFLKTLWLPRLQSEMQAILSISSESLDNLANMADKIAKVRISSTDNSVFAVSRGAESTAMRNPSSLDEFTALPSEIAALSKQPDETDTDILDNVSVRSEDSETEQSHVDSEDDINDNADCFVAKKKVKGKVESSWEWRKVPFTQKEKEANGLNEELKAALKGNNTDQLSATLPILLYSYAQRFPIERVWPLTRDLIYNATTREDLRFATTTLLLELQEQKCLPQATNKFLLEAKNGIN
ncbi:hypothetical protein HNY73_014234 [Argiope bruennichi]|uniref:DUF7041 domain-containing protein n=1 Tax=Argiope bruennichi TaxID=94029 RepID=A0A8T0ESM7_ARGBR|nr:hypothetical protein HNY73_014234 [Argiope bruennichi]